MQRTRFLLIGGFLGAGKTTAIARLARHFMDEGQRVGIVTNDQSPGLVDTESLRSQGFIVGEVPGACFCCRFDRLVETAAALAVDEMPDVILTEPVGSCTDLVATVIEPLRRLHGNEYDVGPLVVLCKPEHGARILGGEGTGFSPQAAYIFHKQLEEADVIVVNKADKLTGSRRNTLLDDVHRHFPNKRVLVASATTGEGFSAVIDALQEPAPTRTAMLDVDYGRHAAGEAAMGWLNATATLGARNDQASSADSFSLDAWLVAFAERLRQAMVNADMEPAHLKVLATSNGATSVVNVVDSTTPAQLSIQAGFETAEADLIINARVIGDPDQLATIVRETTADLASEHGLVVTWKIFQSFRPGRPAPTHRDGQR